MTTALTTDADRMVFLRKLYQNQILDSWTADMIMDLINHERPLNEAERQWADELKARLEK